MLKFFIFIFIFFSGSICAQGTDNSKISIYGWSEYISEDVLNDFEKETGIAVDYVGYEDPDLMVKKLKVLKGRRYDLIITTSFIVNVLKINNLIREIDFKRLENIKNLDRNFLTQPAGMENNDFTIPYLWGSTSLLINTDRVEASSIKVWDDLWDPKWVGKILLLDSIRDVFDLALRSDGHSVNSENSVEIVEAYNKLKRLAPNIKMFSTTPAEAFLNGEVDIGLVWNGDAAELQAQDPKFQYIYPDDGFTVWVDNFAIASQTQNIDNVYKFLDFMLRPDIAKRCAVEMGFATPNHAGAELLDVSTHENPTIYPPVEALSRGEQQMSISESRWLYDLYWTKFRVENKF